MGRKRDNEENFVGKIHHNPTLDSRIFVVEFPDGEQKEIDIIVRHIFVEFPDGEQKEISYNILAEHLLSQVDEEGNQYRLFKAIVSHRRNKNAVDKADQYRYVGNKKYKKKQEQDALVPIITKLVDAIDDFGGGFHKPAYKDLLIVSMVKFPFSVVKGIIWECGFWIRRLQKKELSDGERAVLTERAVGITWVVSSEEEQQGMMKRELWIKENLKEWKEEQEIKNLSATEQKMYYKLKKKGSTNYQVDVAK